MNKALVQKALISGTAALGILGFASPAVFAGTENNGYQSSYNSNSSYNNSYDQDYMRCYRMSDSYGSSYDNDWRNSCMPRFVESSYQQRQNSYGNNCYRSGDQYSYN